MARRWRVHLENLGDKYIGEVNYGRIHGFGTYTWRTNSKCAAAAAVTRRASAQAEPLAPRSPSARRAAAGTSGSGRTGRCTGTG